MEVLSGPWADLALLLRQTIMLAKTQKDFFLPLWLFVLLLFLSVCLLLLQLIIYLSWKLRQGGPIINFSCEAAPGPLMVYLVWRCIVSPGPLQL